MNKFFILLLCIVSVTCFAQQQVQNSNWHFGHNSSLKFLPNPYNPISSISNIYATEGVASVSDHNGQLLFYAGNTTVYKRNHQPMLNGTGLYGGTSNTQGYLIIPKPQSKRYYLIYIDGTTGGKQGLHYSEIDMEMDSGYGNVVLSTKNTPILDANGDPIEQDYHIDGNSSEKLTSTVHCNGIDYWLVTQIENNVYSYLVSQAGISTTPVVSAAPLNISGLTGENGVGAMKISRNSERIAIGYGGGSTGYLALGNFNNITGEVTFDPAVITLPNVYKYYGLEFSPNSQYLYFTADSAVYKGDAYTATSATVSQIGTLQGFPGSFQLAPNGKIYICEDVFANTHLSVINYPDNYNAPGFQVQSVALSNGQVKLGLPQWVHWQTGKCVDAIILDSRELNFLPHTVYHYAEWIATNDEYYTTSGQDITLKAGNYIIMEPNTFIASGSKLLATIEACEECPSSSAGRMSNNFEKDPVNANTFKLYPNPAKDFATVTCNENITRVTVTAMDGKQVMEEFMNKAVKEHTLNINRLQKGIYMIIIHTSKGNNIYEKLIIE